MTKKFFLSADQIAPIFPDLGGCLATDRIVVDGQRVGYMYRTKPIRPEDSGWRFFAGDEDEAYMAVQSHHDVYQVNTILNYDPSILPFIDAEIGSKFERDEEGDFVLLDEEA
ncbi:DUF2185 domain-containing protein [Undibacterium terreum]|uniref:Immunity protein Imm33 domain-containing protein n=1 Tax=Undibacterium terreum TaxID=1224302 RepID=A0A916XJN8_9BURK|nr:DUF2185 domain-containing protein [Undibacterium terreum]GGC77019.1 hypothetical protein GCM10011396_25270 [Undibacterium terreum]